MVHTIHTFNIKNRKLHKHEKKYSYEAIYYIFLFFNSTITLKIKQIKDLKFTTINFLILNLKKWFFCFSKATSKI